MLGAGGAQGARSARVARHRVRAIVREAAVSALNQKVASVLTVAVVAALCSTVLLTAGRTEGSATAVLSGIDSSGTRSIVVRAESGSGLDTTVLDRLRGASSIEWVGVFGFADDVTNVAFDGGQRVALRSYSGDALGAMGARGDDAEADGTAGAGGAMGAGGAVSAMGAGGAIGAGALASGAAAEQLGLADGVGTVVSKGSGRSFDVAGRIDLPSDLRFLEPVVVEPGGVRISAVEPTVSRPGTAEPGAVEPGAVEPGAVEPGAVEPRAVEPRAAEPVAVLVVRAATPALVGAVAEFVSSVLGVDDPTKVTLETSEQLAAVREQVAGQLSDFGRKLVLSVFGASTVLVAAILTALVMLRRRDFGRRRALGASRSLIVALLLSQTGMLALLGAVIGTIVALVALAGGGQPLPSASFSAAVAVLAVLASVAAAVVPAAVASNRDPLRELRVA